MRDPHSIIDKGLTEAPAGPQPALRGWPGTDGPADEASIELRFPGEDGGRSLTEMAERDLGATLQLLAERAHYITGGTGAAIALRDGDELVCKASTGASAPAVGTLLQVNSGLSGESARSGQTLVCDNALTDGRVNRESCQALSIASVVVMPLVREGAVIGVFELFSDEPYAFGERDLMALERLGSMVHTALDCAEGLTGTRQEPATQMQGEATVVIPMAPPSPVPPPKAETPGNELFERDLRPQDQSSAAGASAKTPGPQLAFPPRIAFHGRAPSPKAGEGAAAPAAEYHAAEGPATIPPPVGERVSPFGPSPGPRESMTAPEPDPVEAEGRKYEGPAVEAAPAMAPAEEVAETSARSASPPPILPGAAVAKAAHASFGTIHRAPPATDDRLSDRLEPPAATADPAPKPQSVTPGPDAAKARSEVASLGRCQTCGFPVSPGRVLCLDCEKKARAEGKPVPAARAPESKPVAAFETSSSGPRDGNSGDSVPLFLAGGKEEPGSWIASHKYLVAAIALVVIGVVALLLSR